MPLIDIVTLGDFIMLVVHKGCNYACHDLCMVYIYIYIYIERHLICMCVCAQYLQC